MRIMITLFALAIGLAACGGGSGSGGLNTASVTTPVGTPVDLTKINGVFIGTSPGSQFGFPSLSGYDALNTHWTGSINLAGSGLTTFEGQSVTKSISTTTLQTANGSPTTATITNYYLASDGSLYKTVQDNGVTYTPSSLVPAPTSAKVGDSGDLAAAIGSDGTTKTTHWALNPDFEGAVQLVVTAVIQTGSIVTSSEVDTIYLNSSGVPTRIIVSSSTYGTTSAHPLLSSMMVYGNAQ